ncbi:class I SAM-dependent methyltransferase [Dokdonia sinensis]|uniref:Class I SAM-dependent methyltransferase n=1 Tax=Dokdonia sinensis TaxID=2479847 RepID=A0A3M0GHC0_9FLAO|nr:class I SAM-dependent methyltransferase [Dokdonia sinensis]RMB60983.1 class I SAM-dependent methyltransferase [Dokdonia sinensis]
MQHLSACPVCKSQTFTSFIKSKAQMHPSDEVFNFDQCSTCALVFLNPRVSESELKEYYTDYYLPYRGPKAWGKYEKMVLKSQEKLDTRRATMVNKFHKLSTEHIILDVGCGNPTFLEQTVALYGCKGNGIDFSNNGWKDEAARFANLKLQVGEVSDLELSHSPDVITMWHYLEHDYEPVANLKILRKLAKDSTTLIFEVPNFQSESREKYKEHWAGWHTPRHTSLFSAEAIHKLLNQSGWEVTKILTYGTLDPYVLYWMSAMEQKGIAWDKNMEEEFFSYVTGMIPFTFKKWQQKSRSLGIMTVVATPISL